MNHPDDLRRVVLASASATRQDVLRKAGLSFEILTADIDEDGYMDVVVSAKGHGSTNGRITWYQNDGSPSDGGWTDVNIDSNIDGNAYLGYPLFR